MIHCAATEAMIREAFRESLWISHAAAARLFKTDRRTLWADGDDGKIRYGRRGSRRVYTEETVRIYLAGLAKCHENELSNRAGTTKTQSRRTGSSTRSSPVIDFAAAHAQRLKARQELRSKNGEQPSANGSAAKATRGNRK
jgi:hypothetical protein